MPRFTPDSRSKLTRRDRGRFSGTRLFDALVIAVCDAGCLLRRELHESWEVARRVRRRFRGGRVVRDDADHPACQHREGPRAHHEHVCRHDRHLHVDSDERRATMPIALAVTIADGPRRRG